MPYPAAHTYVTWFGDGWGAQEIWQVGLRFAGTDIPDSTQLGQLDSAMAALLASTDIDFPSSNRYLGLKVAPQDVNGRYPGDQDAVEFLRPTPLTGAATSAYPQIALCLSWRTSRARGYASNGRMYLPSAASVANTTGQLNAGVALSIANQAATFIGAVNAAGLGPASVMSTVGAGRSEPITGTRIGRVMDTQRRRRNQIPESYTEVVDVPL